MAVAHATLLQELAGWASELDLADIPDRVVARATSQVISTLAAVRAGAQHPAGGRLVQAFGPVLQPDPARSAYTMAALVPWLRLDDVSFAGHVSASTVTVPVAYARARGVDGERLLAAVVAANEC